MRLSFHIWISRKRREGCHIGALCGCLKNFFLGGLKEKHNKELPPFILHRTAFDTYIIPIITTSSPKHKK